MSTEHKPILYFSDPIGITRGLQGIWNLLTQDTAQPVSMYRLMNKRVLLTYKGNRKAPGYSLDQRVRDEVESHVRRLVEKFEPKVIVTSDPAMLFLCVNQAEEHWSWATIDNLRGGVYDYRGIKLLVTYPLTAWMREVRERDIASANDGYSDEEEFEASKNEDESDDDDSDDSNESDSKREDHFYVPVMTRVQVGKFCLKSDWAKAQRLVEKANARHKVK